jgi:hypothetical protein
VLTAGLKKVAGGMTTAFLKVAKVHHELTRIHFEEPE